MEKHDVPMDYIITRDKVIKTNGSYSKPMGIHWDILGDKIKEIPVLQKLKK
jgi:5-formyltetrahydrofolate cyclo-ligase